MVIRQGGRKIGGGDIRYLIKRDDLEAVLQYSYSYTDGNNLITRTHIQYEYEYAGSFSLLFLCTFWDLSNVTKSTRAVWEKILRYGTSTVVRRRARRYGRRFTIYLFRLHGQPKKEGWGQKK